MSAVSADQAIKGLYYSYILAKEFLDEFKRSSKLPIGKDIYVTFSLVNTFKEKMWPKSKDVEDVVLKFLSRYDFSRSKGILTVNILGKKVPCAVEYHIIAPDNFLLRFSEELELPEDDQLESEDYEDLVEDVYKLTPAADLTLYLIPKLEGLSKEESKKALREILRVLEGLKSKIQEEFSVKKSTLRLKLLTKDEETAKDVYTSLKEATSKIATLAMISEPALTMEGGYIIDIKNIDSGLIEALFYSFSITSKLMSIRRVLKW